MSTLALEAGGSSLNPIQASENIVILETHMCTSSVTSGNDVFFVVFWTLHGNAKYLVMMFMDKKVKRCFRNSLAACAALASEFGRLWCNFIFPGCACRLSTTTNQFIFCQTAFCIFSGSCMMFFEKFVDEENVFGICDEFEVI